MGLLDRLMNLVAGDDEKDVAYGRLVIPGDSTFEPSDNPAGVFGQFNPPPELHVTLTAPSGEVMDLNEPGPRSPSISVSRGMSINSTRWRCLITKVRIKDAGDCVLRAGPAIDRRGEPSILVGRG